MNQRHSLFTIQARTVVATAEDVVDGQYQLEKAMLYLKYGAAADLDQARVAVCKAAEQAQADTL